MSTFYMVSASLPHARVLCQHLVAAGMVVHHGGGVRASHSPKPKMGLSKKIKISNTEFDVQTERRFVIFPATKDQSIQGVVRSSQAFDFLAI